MPKSRMYGMGATVNIEYPIAIPNGGTGATTAAAARTALGAVGYSGAQTINRLLKYDASGNAVVSRMSESAVSTTITGSFVAATADALSSLDINSELISLISNGHGVEISSNGIKLASRVGIGTTGLPARALEVVDTVRLSHTPGVHWVEFQALSDGRLRLGSSGGATTITITAALIASNGNMDIASGPGARVALVWGTNNVAVFTASLGLQLGIGTYATTIFCSAFGVFGKTPVARPAAIANPTDLASCITALTALLNAERGYGFLPT